MTREPSNAEETTSERRTTATTITSQSILTGFKLFFVIFLLLCLVYCVQLFVASISYYSGQADLHLEEGLLATLYPWVITVTRSTAKLIFISTGVLIFLRKRDDHISFLTSILLVAFGTGGILFVQNTSDAMT
jgi:hypothetical protein